MANLHDRNLQQAMDKLSPLNDALANCLTQGLGGASRDAVATVLGWIDWQEDQQVLALVEHLGAKQRMGTAIGAFEAGISGLDMTRNAAMGSWKGSAANAFDAFCDVLVDNGRKLVEQLEALDRSMSEGAGTATGEMAVLTRNVLKAADEIADNPQTKKGVEFIRDGSVEKYKDGQLLVETALQQLKDSVLAEVNRIPSEVTGLVKRHAHDIGLRDPNTSRPESATGGKFPSHSNRVKERTGTGMREAIADLWKGRRQLDEAWRMSLYAFGTSANAQATVKAWQQVIAYRGTDMSRCIRWAEALYGAMAYTWLTYDMCESLNQERAIQAMNADWERHRLWDYSKVNGPRIPSGGPDGRDRAWPSIPDDSMIGQQLDALENGWDGRGVPPLKPKQPSDIEPGDILNPQPGKGTRK